MGNGSDEMEKMVREILAPLIASDGGILYLVDLTKKQVKLHLGGTLSGSPAVGATTERIIRPAVEAVNPKTKLVVTNGYLVPDGAEALT